MIKVKTKHLNSVVQKFIDDCFAHLLSDKLLLFDDYETDNLDPESKFIFAVDRRFREEYWPILIDDVNNSKCLETISVIDICDTCQAYDRSELEISVLLNRQYTLTTTVTITVNDKGVHHLPHVRKQYNKGDS